MDEYYQTLSMYVPVDRETINELLQLRYRREQINFVYVSSVNSPADLSCLVNMNYKKKAVKKKFRKMFKGVYYG